MIVEIHNKLGKPQRFEATRVVLRDEIDGPLAVALEVGLRHYYIVHRGDGDDAMNRALRTMGLHETVLSDMQDDLPTPYGKLWTPEKPNGQ